MSATFTATITVTIRQTYGPNIVDPRHVAAWLVENGHFTIASCAGCPDPDECDVSSCPAPVTTMLVDVDTVDTINPR